MPNPDFPSSTCPVVYPSLSFRRLCSHRPEALVPWEQQKEVGHAHPYCMASPHLTLALLQLWRDYFVQTMLRSMFYSLCLAAYIIPIHLHWSCSCVIYQEIMIQSNLNELFQPSPAVFNKVSGIFSLSWYYQIIDSTEITYNTSLLFLWFSSGTSCLVLKMQYELHMISSGLLSMWEGLLCVLVWAQVSNPKEHAQLHQGWEWLCCSLLCFSQLTMSAALILLC